MDLNKVIADSTQKIIDSGIIEKQIEDSLTKTIKSSVDDLLRPYSDFGKDLEGALKSAFTFNFDQLSLPEYHALLMGVIQTEFDTLLKGSIQTQMKDRMQEIFKPIEKEEWKLSEFVEEIGKGFIELDDYDQHESFEFTVITENSNSVDGYFDVYFDKEEDTTKYACQYHLRFNKGGIWGFEISEQDMSKKSSQMLYGFDKWLYQFYAQKCKIVEIDSFETYVNGTADY